MAIQSKFKLEDLDIPEKLELRDYQKEIVNKIDEKIKNGEHSIMVQLSPGGGKTLIMGTLAQRYSQKYNVLSVVHRQEIVKQTMKRYAAQGADMSKVNVAMIQTAVRHTDKIDKPKLIIIDEAHHTMADSYLKVLNKFQDPNIYKIYFTATPWRADGKGFTSLIPEKNLILGPSTQWLIEHGYLSDFDYYQPKLINEDLLRFSNRSGDYTAQSIKKASKTVNPEDVVSYYEKLGGNHQGIVYASTIEQSIAIVREFKKHGISAFHLDGASDKAERDAIIEKYRQGKIKILSNVEIFTEGLDLPNAYVALIARPTMSLSLYLQFAMRVLRPQKGKKAIILDFVGNAEKLGLPSNDFQWTLRSHDVKNSLEPGLMTCPKCKRVFHKKELVIDFKPEKHGGEVLSYCPLCNHLIDKQITTDSGPSDVGSPSFD